MNIFTLTYVLCSLFSSNLCCFPTIIDTNMHPNGLSAIHSAGPLGIFGSTPRPMAFKMYFDALLRDSMHLSAYVAQEKPCFPRGTNKQLERFIKTHKNSI